MRICVLYAILNVSRFQVCMNVCFYLSFFLSLYNKTPTKNDHSPDSFVKVWSELSVCDGLLLRQERLVVPESLQARIIKIAHEGHLGIVNTNKVTTIQGVVSKLR